MILPISGVDMSSEISTVQSRTSLRGLRFHYSHGFTSRQEGPNKVDIDHVLERFQTHVLYWYRARCCPGIL